MEDIPIRIVTRNRASYLHLTLRSLSGTHLPHNDVAVFDDASDDPTTRKYLCGSGITKLDYRWPKTNDWERLGFKSLVSGQQKVSGIQNKIRIIHNERNLGVVGASCAAAADVFSKSAASGVILLQDDVLFNVDWYTRLLEAVRSIDKFTEKQLGVLAGVKLRDTYREFNPNQQVVVPSGITAQCLYISRSVFDRCKFLKSPPAISMQFDDKLCHAAKKADLFVGVVLPFVCQHIGIKSTVRPGRAWAAGTRSVRIGKYSVPPYVLAADVRLFGVSCVADRTQSET